MDSNEVESVQVEQKKKDPKDLAQKIETIIVIIGIAMCFIGAVVPRLSVKWTGEGAALEDIIMNYRERWLADVAKGLFALFFIALGRLEKISWQVIIGILILIARIGSDFFYIRRLSWANHVATENWAMTVFYFGLILIIIAQIMRMCSNAPKVLIALGTLLFVLGVIRVRYRLRPLISGIGLVCFGLELIQLKKPKGPHGSGKDRSDEDEDEEEEFYYV